MAAVDWSTVQDDLATVVQTAVGSAYATVVWESGESIYYPPDPGVILILKWQGIDQVGVDRTPWEYDEDADTLQNRIYGIRQLRVGARIEGQSAAAAGSVAVVDRLLSQLRGDAVKDLLTAAGLSFLSASISARIEPVLLDGRLIHVSQVDVVFGATVCYDAGDPTTEWIEYVVATGDVVTKVDGSPVDPQPIVDTRVFLPAYELDTVDPFERE